MQFYLIEFNTQSFRLQADVLKITANKDSIYEELCQVIGCDSIEFIDYNEDIVIIVDETGKFKPHNPVFNVITEDGYSVELAGKIVFARNIENEFNTGVGSIKYEDIFYLRANLEIQLMGMTKWKI